MHAHVHTKPCVVCCVGDPVACQNTPQYAALFGERPDAALGHATVRRICRRSEIRAARWLEADISVSYASYVIIELSYAYYSSRPTGTPGGGHLDELCLFTTAADQRA